MTPTIGDVTRHLLVPGRGIPRPEHWLRRWAAARHTGPVRAALLVTPPCIDGFEPDVASDLAWVVPRRRLPFRAVVVASRSDPYTTFAQFEQYAEDWGADLFDAGDVGHLDTTSGFGTWPDGERLISELG
jgi:predicted alpha/beta hydrolase family esterase